MGRAEAETQEAWVSVQLCLDLQVLGGSLDISSPVNNED